MLRSLLFLFPIAIHLTAAPAFQGKKTFHQNDGSVFSAHIKGDEYLNWIETDTEDILLFNKKNNQYEHAVIKDNELKPSGDSFVPSSAHKKAALLDKKLKKNQLRELWEKKRQEAFQKRKPKQISH